MQRLEVEDEVELADILEEPVKGLYEDLDQVEKCEWRLGRCADYDEVEGRVVTVGYE